MPSAAGREDRHTHAADRCLRRLKMFKFVPCLFLNSLPLESVGIVGDDEEREAEKERDIERESSSTS